MVFFFSFYIFPQLLSVIYTYIYIYIYIFIYIHIYIIYYIYVYMYIHIYIYIWYSYSYILYIWYSFWAKVFLFHIECWPEWDSNQWPCAYHAATLVTDLPGQTMKHAPWSTRWSDHEAQVIATSSQFPSLNHIHS